MMPFGSTAKPPAGAVKTSFSGQITGPAPTAPTASATAPVAPQPNTAAGNPAPLQGLSRQAPIPSRGGYLGQYVNIVV